MVTRQPTLAATPQRSRRPQRPTYGPRPRWAARLRARVLAGALDRALISGADPACSGALAARAQVLTSPRRRVALATTLERLPELAPASRNRFRLAPSSDAVAANDARLRALAALLRSDAPLYARGLAELSELLCDSTGPLFRSGARALELRLARVEAAMLGAEHEDAAHADALYAN